MGQFHHLKLERKPSEQVIELLEENIIGTPGKSMLYRHKNVRSKVKSVTNPYFANLSIRTTLYGSICLSKRAVITSGKAHQAFYLRYFTFRESFRSENPKNISRATQSTIREDVSKLMSGEELDYKGELVLYAYVDQENIRSKRLIEEFDFIRAGSFNILPFSRFYPKTNPIVKKLSPSHQNTMRSKLMKYYCRLKLVSLDNLFINGTYFVIEDNNGDILCGVQAIKGGWEIIDLPGFSGKLLMNVVPKLPVIGRLFDPDYNFVFLEYLYCKPGHEKELETLLESVLAYSDLHSGVICLDPKSTMYHQMQRINLGLTHKIMGETSIEIVVKTEKKDLLKNEAPFFVSGYDVL